MCGESNAIIRGEEVYILLGYRGGELSFDKIFLGDKGTEEDIILMKKKLMEYEKEEIVDMILTFIKNAEEG